MNGSSPFDHLAALRAWKEAAGVDTHPAEHVVGKSILPMLRQISPQQRSLHTVSNSFSGGANGSVAQLTASFGGANGSVAQSTAMSSPESHSTKVQRETRARVAYEEASAQLQKNCARAEFLNGRFDSSAKILARFAM